jgi:2-(1,2-epoxy-1,2-dihydrophenyl)acetyl-CoA isomerase
VSDHTVSVSSQGHVAIIEFCRPPYNFFNEPLIAAIADALENLAESGQCRAVVLCSSGKHFCAGAELSADSASSTTRSQGTQRHIYDSAVRLLEQPLPIVAAVQGAAVGGGMGLALVCDLRVTTPESRFAAPFARLGVHHGFGLSVTLPLVAGHQRALELLYTGRRISGDEALRMGICDRVVAANQLRDTASDLALEIARSAPLAVRAIRETMRAGLVAQFREATAREKAAQQLLFATADAAEGIRADAERRTPEFTGS